MIQKSRQLFGRYTSVGYICEIKNCEDGLSQNGIKLNYQKADLKRNCFDIFAVIKVDLKF